jgi:opacity protein-like surface antigen
VSRRHAKRIVLSFALILTAEGAARAQTPAPKPAPAPALFDHGYVEAVAESAFGNVTSQSFGAEVGVTVRPALQVFGTFGKIRDVATTEIGTAASTIALALAQLQPGAVSYSVKEPVTFFAGGVRYRIQSPSTLKPYISGGVGVATVTKDVKFLIGGADASSTLAQLVTLGSDISGDETKMMFTLGGGVVWEAWRQLIVDLHYQYGHISTETAITVNRAGVGLGVRF